MLTARSCYALPVFELLISDRKHETANSSGKNDDGMPCIFLELKNSVILNRLVQEYERDNDRTPFQCLPS